MPVLLILPRLTGRAPFVSLFFVAQDGGIVRQSLGPLVIRTSAHPAFRCSKPAPSVMNCQCQKLLPFVAAVGPSIQAALSPVAAI
jgi:hypothetical protein